MKDKEKEKRIAMLGALVYKLRTNLAEIRNFYDSKIWNEKELVEVFNDKYPFKIDLDELYLRVLDWDESIGKKLKELSNNKE